MIMFSCSVCHSIVDSEWVEPSDELRKFGIPPRFEPLSRYWKGMWLDNDVYCSAVCSLKAYGHN